MRIGELIAVARELKGWSLRELEKRCGVSNVVISQIETGRTKSPTWHNVVKITKSLGLKLDRLAKCEEQDDAP
jgi:transcriptional regulator with XRE-family HTH domain